ncbi:MAG: hypothetical protein PHS46_05105 [Candidatus Omnitrophica bacterium]|nr:hypothetical protein [Candidatus Omnitrophota bacterium]
MRLLKSVAGIMVMTLVALVYVHQQVELVKLSYSIETKEKKLKEMLDHKGRLDYNINNLEAPSRLEKVLLSKNIDVGLPGRHNVVKVARLTSGSASEGVRASSIDRRFSFSGIVDFLGPRAEAQARER